MSLLDDYVIMTELAKILGSNYAAVQYVSRVARHFTAKYDYLPLHSEALSYAIRGEMPPNFSALTDTKSRTNYRRLYIRELLSTLDDKEVRDAVYTSITTSLRHQNLTYVYNKIKDESQQARIRILTNMLWYEFTLKPSGGSNNE